jgi:hypothetical protein
MAQGAKRRGRGLAAAIAGVLGLWAGGDSVAPDAFAAEAETEVPADVAAEGRSLTAEFNLEWAVGTHDGESQKLELRIEPTLRLDLPAGFQLGAIGRLRGDAFDRLEPGAPRELDVAPYTRPVDFGDRVALELRELYVQGKLGPAWLRVGKQQVVWGQADGLKVLDLVDPQDFREFILPVFEDSRIPLWTLNTEIPIGAAQLQLLWIPDPSAHHVPPQDGVFAFTAPRLVGPRPPPGIAVDLRDPDLPSNALHNSDAGARLSAFWHGFDLSANALWHWDDVPIPYRSLDLAGAVPSVVVTPGYRRTAVIGGSASNAFGNLTVRAEAAYTTRRFLPVDDIADTDGVTETGEFGAVLGFDWYALPETLFSAQVFPTVLTDHPAGSLRDRIDTNVTLLARRQFRNETLTLETIWIHNLNQGDGLVRPKVHYALRDDLQVWFGFDVFYGTRNGVFGEFGGDDRVVLGFEWGI